MRRIQLRQRGFRKTEPTVETPVVEVVPVIKEKKTKPKKDGVVARVRKALKI